MLAEVTEYLNDLNREYALGEADYNWNGYNDNGSHTLHNALAAAGISADGTPALLARLREGEAPAHEATAQRLLGEGAGFVRAMGEAIGDAPSR